MSDIRIFRDPLLPHFELKICNTADFSYKVHSHEEYSLGLVDSGKSLFWHDGKVAELGTHSLVSLPPGVIHSCNPVDATNWQYRMLFIDVEWTQRFMASLHPGLFAGPIIRYVDSDIDLTRINEMFDLLCSEETPLEKEASVLNVLDSLVENLTDPVPDLPSNSGLDSIRSYLDQSFKEKVTLDDLEQVSGLNKFHIIRLFKASFKIPPHVYQTMLRINFAKKELLTLRPISEVALDAGFYDQSHFCKVFKSHTGMTPEKYQKARC